MLKQHAVRTYDYMWMGVSIIQEVTTSNRRPRSHNPRGPDIKTSRNIATTSVKPAVLSSKLHSLARRFSVFSHEARPPHVWLSKNKNTGKRMNTRLFLICGLHFTSDLHSTFAVTRTAVPQICGQGLLFTANPVATVLGNTLESDKDAASGILHTISQLTISMVSSSCRYKSVWNQLGLR